MYRAYSDGSCKPNPGIMGIGGIIIDGNATVAEICARCAAESNKECPDITCECGCYEPILP